MERNQDYALSRLALLGLIAAVQVIGMIHLITGLDRIQEGIKVIQLDARHHHQRFKGQQL